MQKHQFEKQKDFYRAKNFGSDNTLISAHQSQHIYWYENGLPFKAIGIEEATLKVFFSMVITKVFTN